jgi:dynein light intermediate chain 1
MSNIARSAAGLPPKPGETDVDAPDAKAPNVWSAILQNVKAQDSVALPSDRNVLVLGDNESGKTTLVAKLQGNEDPRKGSGLEYAFIDVRDEYRDDQTRLNVWILDGEAQYQHLLNFALTEKTVENTVVVLSVTMAKPWQILDSLQTWASVLQDHVDKLKLDAKAVRQLQRRVVNRWREYVEPGDELEAAVAQVSTT